MGTMGGIWYTLRIGHHGPEETEQLHMKLVEDTGREQYGEVEQTTSVVQLRDR
jgi:hypothetical protein